MSEKADTVPGLGFKDKEKAVESLKILDGRDPDYQKLAVKGLIGRAKRVLTLTKDKEKLQNINDAMRTFEGFLKDFEKNNRSKENRAYLPLPSIEALLPLREKYGIDDKRSEEFLKAYKSAKGEYKNLRSVPSGEGEPTWDIVRNSALRELLKEIGEDEEELWEDDLPTRRHMQMVLWAYSPDASKIKKNQAGFAEKLGRADEGSDGSNGGEEGAKRRSGSSSDSSRSSDDEGSPKKKARK